MVHAVCVVPAMRVVTAVCAVPVVHAEGVDWASLQPPHLESLILNFPGNIKVQWTSSSGKALLDKLILPEFPEFTQFFVILRHFTGSWA